MLQEVMIGKRFVTKLRTMQASQKGGLDEENRAGRPNREGCTSHKEQQLPKLNKDKMEVHREILCKLDLAVQKVIPLVWNFFTR